MTRRRARARPLARRSPAAAARSTSRRAAVSIAPRSATCAVQGASTSRCGDAQGDAPEGGVPLPDRGGVVQRDVGAGGVEPAERTVDVRPPRCGPTFHDDEPVGREDERRELAAQLLRRPQRRTVEARTFRLGRAEAHRDRRGNRAAAARQLDPRGRRRPAGSAAGRSAFEARSPGFPRAATRGGSSCPAPFAPVTRTRPGSSASSSRAYDRKSRSVTSATISRRA